MGLGYAGMRYLHAFEQLSATDGMLHLEVAYVSRTPRPVPNKFFRDVPRAVSSFLPDVVIICVNDISHASVLGQLEAYRGTVICEKPLLTPVDDWYHVQQIFGARDNAFVAQIERYSSASAAFRTWLAGQQGSIRRVSFLWAKNRIGDPRPTCGITSEVVHPLDLIPWLARVPNYHFQLVNASTISSDFSVSGPDVIDTVLLSAKMGEAAVAGYSSFVSVDRLRTLQFIVDAEDAMPRYARLTYDTPQWDADSFLVWHVNAQGESIIEIDQRFGPQSDEESDGLVKQRKLCRDVVDYQLNAQTHLVTMPTILDAIRTQRVLNEITHRDRRVPVTRFFTSGERLAISPSASNEVLG